MSREKSKLTVSQCVTADWCRGFNGGIDVAFNDFETRTCENCISSSLIGSSVYECSKYIQQYHNDDIYHVDGDFGCNKFERK